MVVSKFGRKDIRVALILFGQPRFVDLHYSAWSHLRHLDKYSLSVFGHSWLARAGEVVPVSSWSGLGDIRAVPDAMNLIKQRYKQGRFLFEIQETFDESTYAKFLSRQNNGPNPEQLDLGNVISQLTSIHRALELFDREADSDSFDFVVLSRFDTVLLSFPDLKKLSGKYLYLSDTFRGLFPDMVMLGNVEQIRATDSLTLEPGDWGVQGKLTPEDIKQSAHNRRFGSDYVRYVRLSAYPIRKSGKFLALLSVVKVAAKFAILVKLSRLRKVLLNKRDS